MQGWKKTLPPTKFKRARALRLAWVLGNIAYRALNGGGPVEVTLVVDPKEGGRT